MHRRTPRIGEILAANGLVTRAQVEAILARQKTDNRPFGAICEEMYGIDPGLVEAAWVDQYKRITGKVEADFQSVDPAAISLVTARQAWQFCFVPLRFDQGILVAATVSAQLARANRFAACVLQRAALFVVVDAERLAEGLTLHYPIEGLDARHVRGGMRTQEHRPGVAGEAA